MTAKYIFVTGGVVSSIGKGICVASIGRILKSRGLSVSVVKLDPYLNVDPGTMSPYQHGEVFVTKDGGETDLDLGHYERFIDVELTRSSNVTAGQVYMTLISRERRGDFLGGTIQTVPHVTNEIKARLAELAEASQVDVVVVEVGGTVGDIEGLPFLEAIRQMRKDVGRNKRLLRAPDPAALHLRGGGVENQAHPAQRQGVAQYRHPARRAHLPQRHADFGLNTGKAFPLLRRGRGSGDPPGNGG